MIETWGRVGVWEDTARGTDLVEEVEDFTTDLKSLKSLNKPERMEVEGLSLETKVHFAHRDSQRLRMSNNSFVYGTKR